MKTILLFFLGASIGSFLGLVIDRFPEESILFPASHCNHCKKHLKAWDLIPIISQLSTKSKCRYCHQKIPYWYLLLEISAGVLVVLTDLNLLGIPEFLLLLSGIVLAIYDIKHHEFPLVVWAFFTFLIALFSSLNWMFVCFLLLAFLAQKINLRMGAGDFLFLASLTLIFPLSQMLWLIQLASILGILIILFFSQKRALPFIPFLLISGIVLLILT